MLSVVCFLWFDPNGRYNDRFLYTADHVNRLRRMVGRHLARPHRFVCAADSAKGLDKGIDVVPIDWRLAVPGWRYQKLDIFRPDAAEVYGDEILLLDLDCVVCGSLEKLLRPGDEFRIWNRKARRAPYNSSIIYLKAGTRSSVYTTFDPATSHAAVRDAGLGGSDQGWIRVALGPDEPTWDETDGVMQFKRHVLRDLPASARVVFFNGKISPALPGVQQRAPWIREHWQ